MTKPPLSQFWSEKDGDGRPELKSNQIQNFLDKIDKSGECWVWTARKTKTGYGLFSYRNSGRQYQNYAHRISYELYVGKIPDGLQIDHLCRNRSCVNPEHLEPVTALENTRRKPVKSIPPMATVNREKTHCINGHEYTEENTGRDASGYRKCKECARLNTKSWREKRDKTTAQSVLE